MSASLLRIGAANTMYEIVLSRQAVRYLERLDRTSQRRLVGRLEPLAENPLGPFTKPLTNAEGLPVEPSGHMAYRLSSR